jgi:L-histidine Nalpha-methyltransferase
MSRLVSSAKSSFEHDEHRREFLAYLKSRSGYVPLKFAYGGSAAITHDNAARSSQYRTLTANAAFEARQLITVASDRMISHVCEIGPGNGVHTVAVLRNLAGSTIDVRQYLALDISGGMLDLTERALTSEFSLTFSRAVWDIESGPTKVIEAWRPDSAPTLALLLGLTFGNVESPDDVLSSIRNSLRVGDILAIGVALRTGVQEPDASLSPYQTELFRSAVLEPFAATGIPLDLIDLQLEFHSWGIEAYAVPRTVIDIGDTRIPVGSRIRCFLSRRFEVADLDVLLAATGFRRTILGNNDVARDVDLVVAEVI